MKRPAALSLMVTLIAVGGTTACTRDFASLEPVAPHATPVLTALTPTSAFANNVITLAGTGLLDSEGVTTVTFASGLAGTVVTSTATALTVKVPDHAGNGPVTVATLGGKANSPAFTFIGPGEPRTNRLSNAIAFQASPLEATVTGNGAVLTATSDPLQTSQVLLLRSFPGVGNPLFTQAAAITSIPATTQYQHVYPVGNTIIVLNPDGTAVEYAPPTMGSTDASTTWSTTNRSATWTVASDPNWDTTVGVPLSASTLLVVFLTEMTGGGETAFARVVDLSTPGTGMPGPAASPIFTLLSSSPQTMAPVIPAVTLSQDGLSAVLVAGDGHAVLFKTSGVGVPVQLPGAVMSAAPNPDGTNTVIVARSDGSVVSLDPTNPSGTPTTIAGSGPVVQQMLVAPGVIAMAYPRAPDASGVPTFTGVAGLTLLDSSGELTGLPLPFVPDLLSTNPDGDTVAWAAATTQVAKISLTHRVVDWNTDVPFVGSGVAPLADGIVADFKAPVPYLVGLASDNLATPVASVPAPVFAGHIVADASRGQIWVYGPDLAVQQAVTFSGTNTTSEVSKFIAGVKDQIVGVVPAPSDIFILLTSLDGVTTRVSTAGSTARADVGPGAAAVLGAVDPTGATLYVLAGANVIAVDTATLVPGLTVNLATALSEPGLVGQTLDVTPDGQTAIVTDGSEIILLSLPALTVEAVVPAQTAGGALAPDGRSFYCVLTTDGGQASSLAHVDVPTQNVDVLFELPNPGPTREYSTDVPPVTTYALTFSPSGDALYLDNLYSGEILHVE